MGDQIGTILRIIDVRKQRTQYEGEFEIRGMLLIFIFSKSICDRLTAKGCTSDTNNFLKKRYVFRKSRKRLRKSCSKE